MLMTPQVVDIAVSVMYICILIHHLITDYVNYYLKIVFSVGVCTDTRNSRIPSVIHFATFRP